MKRFLPITLVLVLASSTLTYANSPLAITSESTNNLVPVREVANKYGYTTHWNSKDKTITLKNENMIIVGKVGSTDYVINGDKVSIENSPIQVKDNVAYVPSIVFNTILSLEPNEDGNEITTDANGTFINLSEEFLNDLLSGNYDKSSEKLNGLVSGVQFGEIWKSATGSLGAFVKIDKDKYDVAKVVAQNSMEYLVVTQYVEFEKGGLIIYYSLLEDRNFIGFNIDFYTPESVKSEMPNTIEEIDYKVGVEDAQNAKLTKAKNSKSDTVVLLVSGSGPNDLNEEILGNKPFRDIAWGLAEQGVDTFRFDKVTYAVKSGAMKLDNPEKFTLQEEYVNDVVEIREMLLDMGYKNIYFLGHSQGALVAPRVYDEVDGGFDGLILMAGTPRTLTEVQITQNYEGIKTLPEAQQKEYLKIIEAEVKKYENVNNLTDEQLIKETIFGIPAYYVKEAESYDTTELAKAIDKPVLVLQGSADFQVSAKTDYEMWKEIFAENKKAEFVLYDGLGHLFTKAPATPTNTINDYIPPQVVEKQVISDIVSFIKNN